MIIKGIHCSPINVVRSCCKIAILCEMMHSFVISSCDCIFVFVVYIHVCVLLAAVTMVVADLVNIIIVVINFLCGAHTPRRNVTVSIYGIYDHQYLVGVLYSQCNINIGICM